MNVLIVVESSFGSTAAIADAVAAGLRSRGSTVAVHAAATAPRPDGVDLLVVGSPTHNLGLPTPASRAQAVQRGGRAVAGGVREWLDALGRHPVRAAAFDTHVAGAFSGSAARRIARGLRRSGATVVATDGFLVAGTPAAPADGELARAERWGAGLA